MQGIELRSRHADRTDLSPKKPSCFDLADEEPGFGFIGELERVIGSRLQDGGTESDTAQLASEGSLRIVQKIGEEGVALAATQENQHALLGEAADLVDHLLVLLKSRELFAADVAERLAARHHGRDR